MTENRDFFIPENVDAQVERLSSPLPAEPVQQEQSGALAQALPAGERSEQDQDASTRLVRELQAYYQADYQQNQAFLARARQRIAAHQLAHDEHTQARTSMDPHPVLSLSQERTRQMPYPRSTEQPLGRKLSRGLSLIAAVLVTGLLVGTLAVVLTLSHGQRGSQGSGGKKTTATSVPTPTPVATGTVLYTIKSPAGTNFDSVAWSPDGTRVAAAGIDLNGKMKLYIWDAVSGKNLLTVPLSVDDVGDLLWSPTGKYLSLDNLQTIAIVDSQTGALVNTITYKAPTAFNASGARQLLSSAAPLGGGFGFYSVAWTPDGASLGVAVSNITTGNVVLLDPLTGTVKKTFSEQAAPIGLAMAFSSDGQYIAISYPNDSKIVVWSVATRHVVFALGQGQSMTIGWQPGTHHLARSVEGTVQLWDVSSKKLLTTYKESSQGSSGFAWSPDGKELAMYTSSFDWPPLSKTNHKVTILNAATGAPVGSYTSKNEHIFSISWSPDSRFIATSESTNDYGQIVVWTA